MRVFIAIELPDKIKEELKRFQKKFEINGVKLVDDFHLTLKFLGEINEKQLELIKEKLKNVDFKRVKVKLSGIGVFPNEKRINVVWIGVKPTGRIIELQQKIDRVLLGIFPRDDRFHPHFTLGRVKFLEDKELLRERIKLSFESEEFEISSFKLIESELFPEGPKYKDLEMYSLD